MGGVLDGFAVIFVLVGVGYLLGRSRLLGEGAMEMLARLVFTVATPALLFLMLAKTPVSTVFSPEMAVAGVSVLVVGSGYFVVAKVLWGRDLVDGVIGALAASYSNSTNLGIPIATFILGGPQYVTPLVLFQMVVYQPVALSLIGFGHAAKGRGGFTAAARSFANPMLLGGVLGLLWSGLGLAIPEFARASLTMLGAMTVPSALLVFGMSFAAGGVLDRTSGSRPELWLAVVLKSFGYPFVAYLLGRFVFGLTGHALLVAAVMAALPTAQMVYVFSLRYGRGQGVARDATFVTTLLSIPVVVVLARLLG